MKGSDLEIFPEDTAETTTPYVVTQSMVRSLLTKDSFDRKRHSWKFLSQDEMSKIWDETNLLKQGVEYPDVMCYGHDRKRERMANKDKNDWMCVSERMKGNLETAFPFTHDLLKKFKGKLYVCGGAIFRNFHDETNFCDDHDIDFFFVDPDQSVKNQNRILEEVLNYLSTQWLSGRVKVPSKKERHNFDEAWGKHVMIMRNKHSVTFYGICPFGDDMYDEAAGPNPNKNNFACWYTKYQFILRIYPSVESILGGFDLGPSMVAYDGENILATEFGAWSFMTRHIIVDTTRRSTTYEKRIQKYMRGGGNFGPNHHSSSCNLILPGLSVDIMKDLKPEKVADEDDVLEMVKKTFSDHGYQWIDGELGTFSHPDIGNEIKLRKKIEGMALKYGFEVKLLDLEKRQKAVVADEKEMMAKINTMLASMGYYWDKYRDDEIYLEDKICKSLYHHLKLPFMNLTYRRTTLKKPSNSGQLTKRTRGYGQEKGSDYGDKNMHPYLVVDMNSTALRNNHLNAVCSFVMILPPGMSLSQIDNCMDKYQNTFKRNAKILEDEVVCLGKTSKLGSDLAGQIEDILKNKFFGNGDNVSSSGHVKVQTTNVCLGNVEQAYLHMLDEKFDENSDQFKRFLYRRFAEYGDEVFSELRSFLQKQRVKEKSLSDSRLAEIVEPKVKLMMARMRANREKVEEMLKEVSWITQNPGRQWTSSINPVMTNPREWYGEKYQSFRIGDLELELNLRVLRNRRNTVMRLLNRDLFEMLLYHVLV